MINKTSFLAIFITIIAFSLVFLSKMIITIAFSG